MVLDRKTNFFLGKRWFWTGKPIFSKEKVGFRQKNQLFPRKKMVLGRKTNFFLGKRWPRKKDGFGQKNQLFPWDNQKNHLFGVWLHSFPKDGFFCFFGFS